MKKKRLIVALISAILITSFVVTVSAIVGDRKMNSLNIEGYVVELSERERNIVADFNEAELTLSYLETRTNEMNGTENHVYTDKLDNQYILDSNDIIIGFLKSYSYDSSKSNVSDSAIITKELRKSICEEFLSNITDIKQYTLSQETLYEDQGYYEFTYYKMLNGIKTSDFIFIDISPTGEIVAFAAPNIGDFDNVVLPKISIDAFEDSISKTIEEKYADMTSYEVTDSILQKTEEGVELIVYYEVNISDGKQFYQQGDALVIPIA